jgi:hypothetical protein
VPDVDKSPEAEFLVAQKVPLFDVKEITLPVSQT